MGSEIGVHERKRRNALREQVLRRAAFMLGFDGDYNVGGDAFIASKMGVLRGSVQKVRRGGENFSAATVHRLRRELPAAQVAEVDLNVLTSKVKDIKASGKKAKKKAGKAKPRKKAKKKTTRRRSSTMEVTTPSVPCVLVLLADGKQLVAELPDDAVVACGPKIQWVKGRRSGTVTLEFVRKRTR